MIVGFNHNVSYRGVGFHVQTEDSGVKSPQLVTLLYHSGTIIASQKTVYADIVKVDNLSQVVEELAKEQHKGMLRRLTRGEFDQRILELGIPLGASAAQPAKQQLAQDVEELQADSDDEAEPEPKQELPEAVPIPAPAAEPVTIVEEPIVDKFRQPPPKKEPTLDELILAYLSGEDGT